MHAESAVECSFVARVIRAEFREMPGMRLTLSQAAKLWHLPHDRCADLFGDLVREGFLIEDHGHRFALRRDAR